MNNLENFHGEKVHNHYHVALRKLAVFPMKIIFLSSVLDLLSPTAVRVVRNFGRRHLSKVLRNFCVCVSNLVHECKFLEGKTIYIEFLQLFMCLALFVGHGNTKYVIHCN